MTTYGVAVVPEVEDLEGNSRLSTLARLERCAGVEDCRAELQGRLCQRYHLMQEIAERLLANHADCRQTGMGMAGGRSLDRLTYHLRGCSGRWCRHR